MLVVKDLVCGYSKKTAIIGPISFELGMGNVLIFQGPNGVGKSTLLKTLATILKPISGSLLIQGRPAEKMRNKIFFLQEAVDVPQEFTAIDYLMVVASFYNTSVSRDHVAEILVDVAGIPSPRIRLGKMSQGQRRRVQLASALLPLKNVYVFILDDPGVGLDEYAKLNTVPYIVSELAKRGCVVVSTRDAQVAASIKEKVANARIEDATKYSRVVAKLIESQMYRI
ncbi:ABC transporter ATP-binding protein [Desulfurococcus amylolyticus]|uniref:ABC transporter related protein n=1 Tax=Desulfurococcus amylolyticus DSM 16532 TaxID=768672 RepID=I3XTA4_DESAM|nr:ATP-binding cassette domain-containing protein [Desulfurococcus amylolyticus]AFL67178.1 ABC transporter related protein [Desulfurococcus amylolyticus DSM 16532]